MNQVNISIPDLFKEAFGLYGSIPLFFLGDATPDKNDALGAEKHLMSETGVPVWDRFGFKLSGTDFGYGNDQNELFYMPVVTTAEVSDDKNIVLTDLIGSKGGTVKELMGDGDKVITFRGLVINNNNTAVFPEDEIRKLNTVYNLKASLPVVSKFLNNCHNINNLVFIKRQWLAMEGYANVIKFEFTALSDENIILELTN